MKRFVRVLFITCCLVFAFASFASYADESESKDESILTDADTQQKSAEDTQEEGMAEKKEAKPLLEFDYGGKHIKTYGTYSVIDGEVCDTHRYFVRDGKLVVIDQKLNPVPDGVFIHYDDGKSYIVVLGEDGKIVSLGTEDELNILKDFSNQGITSMSDNISKDSEKISFEYDDGGIVVYDCITGDILYQKEGTRSEESVGDLIGGYISKFIGGTVNKKSPNASAAQNLVNTLNASGITLESLIDSGVAEKVFSGEDGIASDPDPDSAQGNTSKGTNKSGGSDGNTKSGKATGGSEEPLSTPNGKAVTLESAEESVEKTITASVHEMTESEKKEVSKLVNQVSRGEKTASDAASEIGTMIPELSQEDINEVKGELESVESSRAEQIKADAAEDEAMYGKSSRGSEEVSGASEKTDGQFAADGDMAADGEMDVRGNGGSGKGTNEKGKSGSGQFIKSDNADDYVSVYNAEKDAYDIYSVDDLLENPEGAESELAKISDKTKLETIEKLLAKEKDKSAARGILLYALVAVAICGMIALMVVKPKRKRDEQK